MQAFSIGLSGLEVAQRAIELIGTNIANASTEGYHRQSLVVRPIALNSIGSVTLGGAEVTEVRRAINTFLEQEITRQHSGFSQASQELDITEMIESAFGELGAEDPAKALDAFFGSLTELASDPSSQALREQVIWAADAFAGQLRSIMQFLEGVERQIQFSAEMSIEQANELSHEIAALNKEIDSVTIRGGSANMLQDRRDQAILELADLAGITVGGQVGESQSLHISAWGTPVVTGSTVVELEVASVDGQNLGVSSQSTGIYRTEVRGGKIGALLAMNNDLLSSVRGRLDTLADELRTAINQLHVQGISLRGPFTELTGMSVVSGTLDSWSAGVTAGSFYVRLTDTATGAVTRHEIQVEPATDELTDIRDSLDAINGLSASILNSGLHIQADTGYAFDFSPAMLSTPYTSTITGDATATVGGIYEGSTNQEFTCTVVGDGNVGVSSALELEIRDGGGALVRTANIGQGYGANSWLDVGLGMRVALSAGQLNDGDEFTLQALANTDASGFLAAAGINTFFSGDSACTLAVREEVLREPWRFAGSIAPTGVDGINVSRMDDVGRVGLVGLGGSQPQDYFHRLVTDVGQAAVVRRARKASAGSVLRQLDLQRDNVSGVDLNEEAAQLVLYERMFQAMSKVIAVQERALEYLFQVI